MNNQRSLLRLTALYAFGFGAALLLTFLPPVRLEQMVVVDELVVNTAVGAVNGLVELTLDNLDTILKSSQVTFVVFCAEWCPFSRRLKPIFKDAANKWHFDNPGSTVTWGFVDSDSQPEITNRFGVEKYPTMKIFIDGDLMRYEYRSTRSVDALIEFVKDQLKISIKEYDSLEKLHSEMASEARNVIAAFSCHDCVPYQNFQKVTALLRKDCAFWVATGAASPAEGHSIVFKDPHMDDEQKYTGNFEDYDFMKSWITDKCVPLVREVTFDNVEELTEEGLPFLLFFRDPEDKESEKLFTETVARELHDLRSTVNPLFADGHKFAHPLKHLGKQSKDLPVLAIDSFQHMFLFDDMKELPEPGKLRQFVLDLNSGDLHKKFHESLEKRMAELQREALRQLGMLDEGESVGDGSEMIVQSGEAKPPGVMPPIDTTPPASVFKDLKPSDKRYTLLDKTEL